MLEEFNFTSDFQDLIIACAIKHPEKFTMYGDVIKTEYFSGINAQIAWRSLSDYRNQYKIIPTWETLQTLAIHECRSLGEDETTRNITEYIRRLRELNTKDYVYVSERVVDFAKERAYLALAMSVAENVRKHEPLDNVVKQFDEISRLGINLEDLGILLNEEYAYAIKKVTAFDYGIHTGYPLLDQIWVRGWGPGWLIVPLGPPKHFKTAFCINLALNMASVTQRHDVLYYACEISEELASIRALQRLTFTDLEEIYRDPDGFISKVDRFIDLKLEGRILIKGYPAKTVTIQQIEAHAKMVTEHYGLKPKAIIIDYAETVMPSSQALKTHNDPRQQASIYTEARALGHALGCCVIMPDRCNRETVGRATPSLTSFQGSMEKAGIVDAAIGLCGTEEELKQNIMRFFIFLNRHGRQWQHFRGSVNPETMDIAINEEIPYEPEKNQSTGNTGDGPRQGTRRKPKFSTEEDDMR